VVEYAFSILEAIFIGVIFASVMMIIILLFPIISNKMMVKPKQIKLGYEGEELR